MSTGLDTAWPVRVNIVRSLPEQIIYIITWILAGLFDYSNLRDTQKVASFPRTGYRNQDKKIKQLVFHERLVHGWVTVREYRNRRSPWMEWL
jgi:hypothetical protein